MFSLDRFGFVKCFFFVVVFCFFVLNQSDSFFHFQCLQCPALVDRPCLGGYVGGWYYEPKVSVKCCRI